MIIGAVLAAGSGTRMGTPKAELEIDGTRLLDRAVATMAGCGLVDLVVAVVRTGTRCDQAIPVVNPAPERGMRSSLALAVDEAAARGAVALAVLLVDTPGIPTPAVRDVVGHWRPGRIAVGAYGGRRAHPIVMDVPLWRLALDLADPDEGARALMRARPDLVDEVAVAGDPADLDTPADLLALSPPEPGPRSVSGGRAPRRPRSST